MQTKLSKWGNSLALRLPHAMAFELGLENEGLVELVVRDGNIVIQPVRRVYLLEDLVKEITPENRHSETDWGAAEGAEFS